MFPVKEECPGASSSWRELAPPLPLPMEGLNEMGPPPFLTKTFDMVDDSSSDCIVSWSRGGHSFVVWDPHAFSASVLPRYFKHNNFSSFVRQLNTYGFRKIDAEKWEFANESFLQGQRHLIKQIRRRKTNLPPPFPPNQGFDSDSLVEVGPFGLDVEIDTLRRDKQVLVTELVKLRQQQQTTRACLQQMEVRLQSREKKQQQMMSFLARAMENPKFVHQLVQHKEKNKEIEEAMSKKRQRPIEGGESSRVKVESDLSAQLYGYHVSELEALAMEMQGLGRAEEMEMEMEMGNERELDDGFWEELLSEEFEEREDGGEDVSGLAERLGFLGNNSSK